MLAARTQLALAATTVAVAALVAAPPATADTGVGTVVGNGTISPGLTNTPASQTVSFTGRLVAAGTGGGSGAYSCSFSGKSVIKETLSKGQGTARGTCTGAKGTVTATVSYLRIESNVRLNGRATGAITGTVLGDCNFLPTSAPQVRSYQLQCALALR